MVAKAEKRRKGKAKKHSADQKQGKGKHKTGKPKSKVTSPDGRRERAESTVVDVWFDPICPWAWRTSRWMLEVERVRAVKTIFHVMSLAVLAGGRELPAEYECRIDAAWAPARVALAVERHYGQEQLAAFYTAIGTRFHSRREPRSRETIEAALAEVGLSPQMADLGYTGDNDDDLRASHHAGMDPLGDDAAPPVIHLGGVGWIGPVLTPGPTGQDAGGVFDAVRRLTSFPGFYGLTRTRSARPTF